MPGFVSQNLKILKMTCLRELYKVKDVYIRYRIFTEVLCLNGNSITGRLAMKPILLGNMLSSKKFIFSVLESEVDAEL